MRAATMLTLAIGTAAFSASATDAANEQATKSAKPTTVQADQVPAPVAQSGVRVYIDPQTGRRTANPTAEQRRAAAAQDALNADFGNDATFETETLPSGAVILHTRGKNQSVVIAKPGADGRAVIECNDATHQSLGQHEHAAPVPATVERDVR